MKTKTILVISAVAVVLIAGIFFLVGSKKTRYKAEKSEITAFLNGFNNRIQEGNTDSLLTYFDSRNKLKALKKLVNLLAGKNSLDGKGKPVFDFSLDVDNSDVKIIDADLAQATLPANFKHDSVNNLKSWLTLKIRKVSTNRYKIVQVDAKRFLADFASYENLVRTKTTSNKDIYSAITLKSFKTAQELKTRYDTVVWFAHLDNKTWFYVAKGSWVSPSRDTDDHANNMGLLNPDLKEVIPPKYDVIHNINGIFEGMVEVEKGAKRGLYNLSGKLVVPVDYDQIFPIDEQSNLAVLRNGSDYFYLKKDTTISAKVDLKISDFFSKIRGLNGPADFRKNALAVVTEYNSKEDDGAVFVTPSYLVDLNLAPKIEDFDNPLRHVDFEEVSKGYEVATDEKVSENWFQATFYSIRDYFLGGRSEFYDKRNLIIVDKRNDRVLTSDIGVDYEPDGSEALGGACDVNSIRQINDTLFEVKSGAKIYLPFYDSTKVLRGGPYYHYLALRGNKLVELKNNRTFGFTKYVKMDDSYLEGCYTISEGIGAGGDNNGVEKTIDRITPEMLRLMKNEIFADYRYKFKDKRWQDVFEMMDSYDVYTKGDSPDRLPPNLNVNDSLTVIDKYNINWITEKINAKKEKANSLASR